MSEMIAVAAVLPATVGVCCAAGAHRPLPDRLLGTAVGGLGAVSMTDTMLGLHILPGFAWSALLVLAALLIAFRLRVTAARPTVMKDARPSPVHVSARASALHSSLGAVAMAALVLGDHTSSGGHAHVISGSAMILAGVSAFVVFSVFVAAQLWRHDRLKFAETVAMAMSTLMMMLPH